MRSLSIPVVGLDFLTVVFRLVVIANDKNTCISSCVLLALAYLKGFNHKWP